MWTKLGNLLLRAGRWCLKNPGQTKAIIDLAKNARKK